MKSSAAPTSEEHQRSCHREGRQARCDLPVQFYGHIGTDIAATPYREIPTDGTAVLGMTDFLPGRAVLDISREGRYAGGRDPPLRWDFLNHRFGGSCIDWARFTWFPFRKCQIPSFLLVDYF